jgi:hypothetical protein
MLKGICLDTMTIKNAGIEEKLSIGPGRSSPHSFGKNDGYLKSNLTKEEPVFVERENRLFHLNFIIVIWFKLHPLRSEILNCPLNYPVYSRFWRRHDSGCNRTCGKDRSRRA